MFVAVNRSFVKADRCHPQGSGCLTLEYGTDRLYRNVGEQLPTYAVKKTQKSGKLTYTVAEVNAAEVNN